MKNVLATIVGLIVAFIITSSFEWLSTQLFPLPADAKPMATEWLKANIDKVPFGAMVLVSIAHGLGIIAGMYVAGKISKVSLTPAYIVATLMVIGTLANLFMIPHPTWFMIADIITVAVGFFLGKSLAQRNVFA